jgi:hypothetical protein
MNFLLPLMMLVAPAQWTPLSSGVEYQQMTLGPAQAHVVRIDPEKAKLSFALLSKAGGVARTAADWARSKGLIVAINAGMFSTDGRSNVGYLVDGSHVNHKTFNRYLSVLVFGPKVQGIPQAQLLDLDEEGSRDLIAQYESTVQNLRLIKAPGTSVWKRNGRAWSEAAVAQDKQGRLLFIFTREGVEMAQWNQLLLDSDLEVVRAMHMEGGPEASLSIHAKNVNVDLCGSFETGFVNDDSNSRQWPIPNVLGVESPAN